MQGGGLRSSARAPSSPRQTSGAFAEEEEEQRSGVELCPKGEANGAQFAPTRADYRRNQGRVAGAAKPYQGIVPQNVEQPYILSIETSANQYLQPGENIDEKWGNSFRKTVEENTERRLGIGKGRTAYFIAPNITKNGEEYYAKVTRESLGKMLYTKKGERLPIERLVLLDHLEKAIEGSVWVDSEGDRKSRQQISGFDTLRTGFYIDGRPYYADIKVKVVQSGINNQSENVVYFLEPEAIAFIKKVDASSPTLERPASKIFFRESASTGTSISSSGEKVNRGMETDAERREAEAITQILINDLAEGYRMEARAKKEKAEAEAITQILINDWAMKLREEAEGNGAYAEPGSDTDIETDPLQSILHNEKDEILQTNETGATIEKKVGQEEANGQGAAGANQTEGGGVLWKEPKSSNRGRDESLSEFCNRELGEGRFIRTVDGIGYGYQPIPIKTQTEYTKQILSELQGLGVDAFAYDGELRANFKGKTMVDEGEAATLRDGTVGVHNKNFGGLTPREIAAHEMFHAQMRERAPIALAFKKEVEDHVLRNNAFLKYCSTIIEGYFRQGFHKDNPAHIKKCGIRGG